MIEHPRKVQAGLHDVAGGQHTSHEVLGQPDLWLETWKSIRQQRSQISKFLNESRTSSNLLTILTGAGTSAFIGETLEASFQRSTGIITKAVATTDLVTHPELYFSSDRDILLVSFARSGGSPESTQAVQLSEQISRETFNLVITCNGKSRLTEAVENTHHFTFVLPPEADDRSLAMTGSFTSMLLSGLLVSDIENIDEKESEVKLLRLYGNKIIEDYYDSLKRVACLEFNRAIFLGSGPMKGVARESHLKLQELTDGKVICKFDSFLGFRHGPKAVVNEQTLITYLFTNNKYANRYEVDLVRGIGEGRKPLFTIGVMEHKIQGIKVDLEILLGDSQNNLDEDFLAIVSVMPAQLLGFLKSAQLGLTPDNPSQSGMIHRVVQGVNIYPYGEAG